MAGQKLIVPDYANSRVLIWNSLPVSSNQTADVVLGQTLFTTSNYGTSSTALSYPTGAWSDGTKLFVVDSSAHRILIWDQIPSNNNTPADKVFGQDDFLSSNSGGGASYLNYPTAITKINQHYYILDPR